MCWTFLTLVPEKLKGLAWFTAKDGRSCLASLGLSLASSSGSALGPLRFSALIYVRNSGGPTIGLSLTPSFFASKTCAVYFDLRISSLVSLPSLLASLPIWRPFAEVILSFLKILPAMFSLWVSVMSGILAIESARTIAGVISIWTTSFISWVSYLATLGTREREIAFLGLSGWAFCPFSGILPSGS